MTTRFKEKYDSRTILLLASRAKNFMNWPDLVFGPVNLWTIGPDPRYANIPALSGTTERTHRARRVAMLNRLLMQRNKH